jgi:hypothetical protein
MTDDQHLETIGELALARLRVRLELSDPEPRAEPRPPERFKPGHVITYRRYTNWRLRLAGVRP